MVGEGMAKWGGGVGWGWGTGRGDKRSAEHGKDWSAKNQSLAAREKDRVPPSSMRAFLYLLWMLVGHEAPLVLSHHAPGHNQAISTSREEMPLVTAETLHGSLVATESLQEKRPFFSPLQLRWWVLKGPKLEVSFEELQSHTPAIHDCHLSRLHFCSKKASGVHAPLPRALSPRWKKNVVRERPCSWWVFGWGRPHLPRVPEAKIHHPLLPHGIGSGVPSLAPCQDQRTPGTPLHL